jgi:hypothetical protein
VARLRLLACSFAFVLAGPQSPAVTLPIPPVVQQTQVWCWAAAAEMVFRHYQMPNLNGAGNFQCGIVGAWFQGQCAANCLACQATVGPMSNLHQVVTGYGAFAQRIGVPSRVLSAGLIFRALSPAEVKAEIDGMRPVVIGIAPAGGWALPNASQHVAVLVGYDFSGPVPLGIVNDPYPFDYIPGAGPNPYVAAGGMRTQPGQYRIPLAALANQLGWANSIYNIR